MSDMTYAAQRTAHLLHGKEPWPIQTRVEKLEAALREIINEDNGPFADIARDALAREEVND